MNRALRIWLLVCVALSPPIAHAQTKVCSFVHENAVAPLPRVLALRPRVHIWKDKGFSQSESEGATDVASTGFQGVLARTIEDEGYELWLDTILFREWEETPPNDYAVNRLKDHFNSLVFPLVADEDCRLLSKISLKIDVEKLKDQDKFDVVVLSRASGSLRTKMGKVLGAIDPYGSDAFSFDIGVVDRSSGALLYYCNSTANGDYVDAPDARLSGPIRKCLDQYFNPKPRRRRWIGVF